MRAREALRLRPGDYVWLKREYLGPHDDGNPLEVAEVVDRGHSYDPSIYVTGRRDPCTYLAVEVKRFNIVRFEYPNFLTPTRVIHANVTLREALDHCKRPDTESIRDGEASDENLGTMSALMLAGPGSWFDGWTEVGRGLF